MATQPIPTREETERAVQDGLQREPTYALVHTHGEVSRVSADQETCASCGLPARRTGDEPVVFCLACQDHGFLDELSDEWDDLGGGD